MAGGQLLQSFRIVKRIAVGGFGVVDEGIGPNGEQVAIKRELASDKVTRPILEHEYHIYKALAGAECILDAKAYGRESRFNVMVMDLLGPSLNDRFRDCGKRFSLRTTAILGLGMLDSVEHMHTRGFIHRDIKPDNFLLGIGAKAHTIHPVDFGLARRWRHVIPGSLASSSRSGDDAGVIGTLPYASLHAHLGLEQTRRDDLHALTYTLLLFARGNLPWDHIRGGTRKHCARRILEKKRSWPAARLCRGLPSELQEFADYCFGLEVNETPDYSLLRSKLTTLAREGWNTTPKFEWEQPGWKVSMAFESPSRSAKPTSSPAVKRGDMVLLKVNPEKSLDYEAIPRIVDPSFFPHPTINDSTINIPYRPAIVRRVVVDDKDAVYFKIEVLPLTRWANLDGLSKRRTASFRPIQNYVDDSQLGEFYAYKTSLLFPFIVQYEQTLDYVFPLSIPEEPLAELESELEAIPTPYSLVYDSDDDQTRTIRQRLPRTWASGNHVMEVQPCHTSDISNQDEVDWSGINGWIPDLVYIEELRHCENGGTGALDDESDSDSDDDVDFWDWPRPINRRLSCTVRSQGAATAQGG